MISMSGLTRTLTYAYDKQGARASLTHPDGQKFTYARDGLGRVSNLYEGLSQVAAAQLIQTSFDNRGLIDTMQRATAGSAFLADFSFDPVGRLAATVNDAFGTANDLTISQGYNPASQIISQTRSNDAYSWTGAVAVNRPYTTNGLNQYTSAGSATFGYDANGNLTGDGSASFVYDIENRLVSASGASTAQLRYDPLGRLYETSGGSAGVTRFFYDGDELVAEFNDAGTLLRRYVHGASVDDPVVWYEGSGNASPRWLHSNWQGSVVAVSDASGAAIMVNRYDEWGIPASSNLGRFQYTGQAWIPELGIYHYKARIYSPTLGRFLQTDPIGYDDQINLYAYVGNDPGNKGDSSGKQHDLHYNRMGRTLAPASREAIERDRSRYNARDPVGPDRKLSMQEANLHARHGAGQTLKVDATKLTVVVDLGQQSRKTPGLYSGQVQGDGKNVYGGVSVEYNKETGAAKLRPDYYDFDVKPEETLGRNIKTVIGSSNASSTSEGTMPIKSYKIEFEGKPKIIEKKDE